ncbi:MAG: LysR family transcriptional regulator [Spirochaetales bacterium]|nr:LysR family transcriptional regulator [Spirochaetales bacterium]MDY2923360.1 LysR family transcriptional regulator [Treponema sp.]
MELTQLRYFLKVAELEHITRASEELHIAQPALTQTIHRLENELRIPLFSNKGRNIVLSEYGKYFYKKLKPLLSEIYDLPEQLRTFALKENSTIHLNVLAASSLVTHAIIEYQKIDEKIRFQVNQNEQNDLHDICITTKLFYQKSEREHDSIFVSTENIYLAVPNIKKYQNRESISLEEVKDENFISLSGAKQFRAICDKYCRSVGINPNIIFESDSPAAVKNMIAANIGIGFWPEFTWERINSSKVKLLKISNPICSRDILVTYTNNKTNDESTKRFFEFLKQYFQNELENSRISLK